MIDDRWLGIYSDEGCQQWRYADRLLFLSTVGGILEAIAYDAGGAEAERIPLTPDQIEAYLADPTDLLMLLAL